MFSLSVFQARQQPQPVTCSTVWCQLRAWSSPPTPHLSINKTTSWNTGGSTSYWM